MYKLSQHAIDLHFCYLCYFSMVTGESNSVSEVTSKLTRNKRFYMNDKEEDLKSDFAKGTKKYETFEI